MILNTVLDPKNPQSALRHALRDRLVMREKILEHEHLMRTEYEAWHQSFLTVLAELKAIVESFNSDERYTRIGYWIRLQEYDLLPFEKYEELSRGKKATRTWFVGLEISGPRSSEKALLFFSRASLRLIQNPKASKVALVVSRFDGARYQRLDTEPIGLREVGYQDGELLFLSPQETLPGGTRKALQVLLADIIKAYLCYAVSHDYDKKYLDNSIVVDTSSEQWSAVTPYL